MAEAAPAAQPEAAPAAPPGGGIRVLGVLCGATADAVLGDKPADATDVGPLSEVAGLPPGVAELHVLRSPSMSEVSKALSDWKPTHVYLFGGVPGGREDVQAQAIGPFPLLLNAAGDALLDAAVKHLAAVLAKLDLEALYLDFQGAAAVAAALTKGGSSSGSTRSAAASKDIARHVLAWAEDVQPPVLAGADFAHAFFGALRSGSVTTPEAYALASHMAKTHSTLVPPVTSSDILAPPPAPEEPALPQLLSAPPPAAPGGEDGAEGGEEAAAAGGGASAPALALVAAPAATLLPGMASVQVPATIEETDVSGGVAAAFPGYADLRLLAPNAELRLLLAGVSGMVNPHNLRYLGEALRALLTVETRGLLVTSIAPLSKPPAHLPPGSGAARIDVKMPCGAPCTVTLGGPAELLKSKALVQHALRQAMTADAATLQLKLPPRDAPLPPTHMSESVAGGAPVVEGLAVTSVWCVQLLKHMAQDPAYRGLVLLGLAAVSTCPVAAFGAADATRFAAVTTHNDPSRIEAAPAAAGHMPPPAFVQATPMGPDAVAGTSAVPSAATLLQQLVGGASSPGTLTPAASNAAAAAAAAGLTGTGGSAAPGTSPASAPGASVSPAGSERPGGGLAALMQQQQQQQQEQEKPAVEKPPPVPWTSDRPPLKGCSEDAFMADLIAFLTDRQGRRIDPRTFPEAVLNGSKLDLFNLYREVTSRGGYAVGNGINWKGQVFPAMRNFTAVHRMTGVGNALKRHYQVLLLEYEQANPGDVTGGRCGLCGSGDEGERAADWLSCDACDAWFHFSCDAREGLGAFKDYSKDQGRPYRCAACSEAQADGQQEQQQAEAGGGGGAPEQQPEQQAQPMQDAPADEADAPQPMQE